MAKSKRNVKAKKTINTFSCLLSGAGHLLEKAEENQIGHYYNCMASMIFCAFTMVAYVKHIGSMFVEDWKTSERKWSPKVKLKKVASTLKMPVDYSIRPFSSFRVLFDFCNNLAHGKTEILVVDNIQLLDNGDDPELPESPWQSQNTIENAKEYFKDTQDMIGKIHACAKLNPLYLHIPEISDWIITDAK